MKAALRLVTEQGSVSFLALDSLQPYGRSLKEHLLDKHPPGKPTVPPAISWTPPATEPHPIIFEQTDGPLVRSTRSTIERTSRSAGPSGMDANWWKRMCFNRASSELCKAIATLCRRLCSTYVDPHGISPLVVSRLIGLHKCTGIQPVGVGEVLRRVIGKAVLQIAQEDIQCTVGSLQLCASKDSACEAGIHS